MSRLLLSEAGVTHTPVVGAIAVCTSCFFDHFKGHKEYVTFIYQCYWAAANLKCPAWPFGAFYERKGKEVKAEHGGVERGSLAKRWMECFHSCSCSVPFFLIPSFLAHLWASSKFCRGTKASWVHSNAPLSTSSLLWGQPC